MEIGAATLLRTPAVCPKAVLAQSKQKATIVIFMKRMILVWGMRRSLAMLLYLKELTKFGDPRFGDPYRQ